MIRRLIFIIAIFSFLSLGAVFAQYYDTKNIEAINEYTFGGRIVREALFTYSWVANFGAETKSMEEVLKKIKDTNDGRLLSAQFSYIAEKYTGQKTVKIFVKDVNSKDLFIDSQKTGTGATIAERCKLSGFSCESVSSARFSEGKEYYIKMLNDTPFYINFCSDERESFISGRGCVRTHEFCAGDTGLQRILAEDGFTIIPQSQRTCGCSEGKHLSAGRNQCMADGEECQLDGGAYDDATGICTRTIEVATGETYQCTGNVAQNSDGTQQLHKSFVYPYYLKESKIELDADSDFLLAFISTGARTNGVLYEWKGEGCAVEDSSDKRYGKLKCGSGLTGNYVNTSKPQKGDTVYFSLRAACGKKTDAEDYGLTEKKAKLTLQYYESEQ